MRWNLYFKRFWQNDKMTKWHRIDFPNYLSFKHIIFYPEKVRKIFIICFVTSRIFCNFATDIHITLFYILWKTLANITQHFPTCSRRLKRAEKSNRRPAQSSVWWGLRKAQRHPFHATLQPYQRRPAPRPWSHPHNHGELHSVIVSVQLCSTKHSFFLRNLLKKLKITRIFANGKSQ